MLLFVFLASIVAAVVAVAYSHGVLFSKWGRGHKRVIYAPPPLAPAPPSARVSGVQSIVSPPSGAVAMGSGMQPVVSPLPERFMPPLAASGGPIMAPRRAPKGSLPPPIPAGATERNPVVVAEEMVLEDSGPISHA